MAYTPKGWPGPDGATVGRRGGGCSHLLARQGRDARKQWLIRNF